MNTASTDLAFVDLLRPVALDESELEAVSGGILPIITTIVSAVIAGVIAADTAESLSS